MVRGVFDTWWATEHRSRRWLAHWCTALGECMWEGEWLQQIERQKAEVLLLQVFFSECLNTNSDSFGMISETINTFSQSINKVCQTKRPISSLHSVWNFVTQLLLNCKTQHTYCKTVNTTHCIRLILQFYSTLTKNVHFCLFYSDYSENYLPTLTHAKALFDNYFIQHSDL